MPVIHTRSGSRPGALLVGVLALVALLAACTACTAATAGSGSSAVVSNPESPLHTIASPTLPPSSPSPSPSAAATPVHMSSLESDGATYGVGMPIVVYFDKQITSAIAFVKAATVTVNGNNPGGAWYFQTSARAGEVVEAHYRPNTFWPGHAHIAVDLPMQGLSAGTGLTFDDDLTLNFGTGPANILTVNGATHELTVTTDGTPYGTFPVSLGAAKTPTLLGTKVISEKDRNERMVGSGYNEIVPWSMRLTASGEYLHAASWNVANIGKRNTSNGCTNLLPADAEKLWNFLEVGDPVTYTNTGGTAVDPSWDGYGDWNVPWPTWLGGGLLSTTG
jgi:lipoprotein-anchoring transpeptidase ErfK/SrfK